MNTMRRIAAFAVMVILSGVLPLMASARLCAARSCCRNAKAQSTVSHPSCCGEQCVKAPSDKEVPASAKVAFVHAPTDVVSTAAAVVPSTISRAYTQSPAVSPPTQRRLAALSILLV